MAQSPDRHLLAFPIQDLLPDHEKVQPPVISSTTLILLESLHIQLGDYFSTHANIDSSKKKITAEDVVDEVLSATQSLGMQLPSLYHAYKTRGEERNYEEEKYLLWTGSAIDQNRHSKMLSILQYTYGNQKIYHLLLIDATNEDVGNHYKLVAEQVVTDEDLDHTGTRTQRRSELGVFESGENQHVITIFLDPDLFGSSGNDGERMGAVRVA